MARSRILVPLASLAILAGCADHSVPTAPSYGKPNLTTYAVTVGAPTILTAISGSSFDVAVGINAAGDVAGVSGPFPSGQAVRWAAGTAVGVAFDGPDAAAHDINAHGQLAGHRNSSAALWTPAVGGGYSLTDIGAQLPPAIYSIAWAINGYGQVVGQYRPFATVGPFSDVCFLWTPSSAHATTGTITTFPGLGGTFCVANDINSGGFIAGASTTSLGAQHAFLWSPSSANGTGGTIEDLAPSSAASYGAAVNDGLQVAGQHLIGSGANSAAVWTPVSGGGFTVTELGTFTGIESQAMDINDAGFVVGFARNSLGQDDAFFWQGGVFTTLPGLTVITSPTALTNPSGNLVRVVGAATHPTTAERTALRWDVSVSPVGAQGCLAELIQDVEQRRADGGLTAGEARSLLAKLDAAARQLESGKTTPTRNLIQAFIAEVNALAASGRISMGDATALIDQATCVIDSL